MATFANLQDRFDGVVFDTVKWSSFATGTATIAIGGGVVTCTPPNTTAGSNYAGVDSAGATRDLTGNAVLVKVSQVTNTATNAQTYLKIAIDANNTIDIYTQGTLLNCRQTVATVQTNRFNETYDITKHLWWRIRESGGTTFWDTSGDGKSWVNKASFANPIAVTAVFVEFASGTFQSETSPGAGKFSNFNIIPVRLLNSSLRPYPFSPGLAR